MASGSEIYDQDEIEVPSWLEKDFLTEVLKSHHKNNDLQVKQTTFSPATCKGDHFASIMFRVKIEYQLQGAPLIKSLIIKTMPEVDGLKKDMFGDSDVFYKEVAMYSKILPKFENILKAAGDETVFGPKCIYHTLSPRQVIVMEDLCASGFNLIRGRFAALDECKAAYEKLAKWHALGFKILIEDPSQLNDFRYKWMPEVMEHSSMTEGLDFFIELLDTLPTLSKYKSHFEALRSLKLTEMRKSFEMYNQEPRPAGIYVLNHGDIHSRNVMFNSAIGSAPRCMLVDFQACYMGAPAMDILYSLYMMMDADVRNYKREELISFYYTIFVDTLKKTGFNGEVPQIDDLNRQFLQHKHCELFLLHSFRPIVLGIVGGKFDITEMFQNSELRRGAYYNKEYIDELHITLPKLAELGYFEHL